MSPSSEDKKQVSIIHEQLVKFYGKDLKLAQTLNPNFGWDVMWCHKYDY